MHSRNRSRRDRRQENSRVGVDAGPLASCLGPNGSGKSSVFEWLNLVVAPQEDASRELRTANARLRFVVDLQYLPIRCLGRPARPPISAAHNVSDGKLRRNVVGDPIPLTVSTFPKRVMRRSPAKARSTSLYWSAYSDPRSAKYFPDLDVRRTCYALGSEQTRFFSRSSQQMVRYGL